MVQSPRSNDLSEPGAVATGFSAKSRTDIRRCTLDTAYYPVATALGSDETLDFGLWTIEVINYSEKDGILTFMVRVVPRASRSEIVGEHDSALRVRIAAPPVDGAANEELLRLLSRALGVSRSAIEITAGHSSKLKTVRVAGCRPGDLAAFTREKA